MFEKKKLKNPILVVRTPEEINKEYSEIIAKLGTLDVELFNIATAEERQAERKETIDALKSKHMDRVVELSQEMDEAQKEIQKKSALKKSEETTQIENAIQ